MNTHRPDQLAKLLASTLIQQDLESGGGLSDAQVEAFLDALDNQVCCCLARVHSSNQAVMVPVFKAGEPLHSSRAPARPLRGLIGCIQRAMASCMGQPVAREPD